MNEPLFYGSENLLPANGDVRFYPGFFAKPVADRYFGDLQSAVAWRQEPVKIFGREVLQPRLTAWYGDAGKSYSYSGITMQPHPWTETLLAIKHKADEAANVTFNSALLNLYRDGNDSMGWHRDNEKELGANPVIASVSFGAARRFLLRSYSDKTTACEIMLTHGSLLLMRGETQHYWEHSIPKTARQTGSRINITFRIIL
jgi:alkylated DNA repair dioxygenase AlkB